MEARVLWLGKVLVATLLDAISDMLCRPAALKHALRCNSNMATPTEDCPTP